MNRAATTTIDDGDNRCLFYYHLRPVLPHRRSTISEGRWTAAELPTAPKTVELEQRLSRLEMCCKDLTETMELLLRRTTALQAELEYLAAKLGR